eukprot:15011295-Alexandrium_andersonii.AAC.1
MATGALARTPPAMMASPSLLLGSLRGSMRPSPGDSEALPVQRGLGARAVEPKLLLQAALLH